MNVNRFVPFIIFGLIAAATIAAFFASGAFRAEEKDKIGIIELQGELVTGEESPLFTTTGELQRALENASRDERVKAVVLSVDSPGGTATATYEMYSMVKRFEKPIVAFIRGTGASGSYLVSLGADNVVAHPFSEVGSVGVFIQLRASVPVEPEEPEYISAISSGRFKTLWEDGVLDEAERRFLEMKVEEAEDAFMEIVFEEAPIEREEVENIEEDIENPLYVFREGGWFNGYKALELGLVHELGDLEDALSLASEKAGVERDEATVVKVESPPPGTYGATIYETNLYQDNEILPIRLE